MKVSDQPRFRSHCPWLNLILCMAAAGGLAGGEPVTAVATSPTAALPEILRTPPERVNGYLRIGFDRLAAFPFTVPDYDPSAAPGKPPPSLAGQIPEAIKQLDGQNVQVAGYMLPTKMEKGLVTEFLVVSGPMMCCYGVVPKMNEWIVVRMQKEGVKPLMDVPVYFYGRFKVGEMYENGYLTGIYYLEGERMGGVKE